MKVKYLTLLAATLSTTTALGGGLLLYEIGTPDLGLASAGYAARAQDAATAMTNPAGMTRLAKTELLLGVQPLYGYLKFSPNSDTTVDGSNGGNSVGWFPGGSAFIVYPVTSDLSLGLSTYGNFGLAVDYEDDWVGRFYVQRSTLLGTTIAPAVAYRLSAHWSIGGALNAMYGYLTDRAAVNNSPLGLFDRPDGELRLKDTDWGYGGTLSILFEPSEETRFGITYTTEISLNFEDIVEFTNVLPNIIPGGSFSTPLDLSMKVPQTVMTSFYHTLNPCWALLGNVGWQNWRRFGEVEVTVGSADPKSITKNLHYRDTWHAALGAQYQYSPVWRFSVGTAYDTSLVSDADRTIPLPLGAAWRLGFGSQYRMCDNVELGFGYTLVWGGDLSVDQKAGILTGRVAGEYQNSALNYFGLNLIWQI